MPDPNLQKDLQKRLELANVIAKSAGQLTLNYFQTDRLDVTRKGDGTPLTIADQEAEKFLRQAIRTLTRMMRSLAKSTARPQAKAPRNQSTPGFLIRSTAPNHLSVACRCTERWSQLKKRQRKIPPEGRSLARFISRVWMLGFMPVRVRGPGLFKAMQLPLRPAYPKPVRLLTP